MIHNKTIRCSSVQPEEAKRARKSDMTAKCDRR